jgi:threonine dehydrogenase-like Zn-dependent dehydrogenase
MARQTVITTAPRHWGSGDEDMKAVAVFPGPRVVKVIEQEAPRIAEPDQVMLRMLDIGICGTDKEICSFEYGTPPQGDDHLVIGHESLAEVVGVGSAGSGCAPETCSCRRCAAHAPIPAAHRHQERDHFRRTRVAAHQGRWSPSVRESARPARSYLQPSGQLAHPTRARP